MTYRSRSNIFFMNLYLYLFILQSKTYKSCREIVVSFLLKIAFLLTRTWTMFFGWVWRKEYVFVVFVQIAFFIWYELMDSILPLSIPLPLSHVPTHTHINTRVHIHSYTRLCTYTYNLPFFLSLYHFFCFFSLSYNFLNFFILSSTRTCKRKFE